jgi:ribosomal protein S14
MQLDSKRILDEAIRPLTQDELQAAAAYVARRCDATGDTEALLAMLGLCNSGDRATTRELETT